MFVCAECGASQPTQGFCASDGKPLVPIGEDLLLGTTIGPYRVARLLGIGGMGRVYKGVHPTIGSRVAIKVLSRECSDRRDLVERFFSEAKAVNLIRHESIVNVLDLAMLPDGRPYIIMEYLDGAPLAGVIEAAVARNTPLPIGGVARLVAEVLDALAAAHAKGIVHRDLKPDNIYVAPSGRPKVLDFGIAKLSDMTTGSATATGSLLGTPHYMSPEQAAGKPVDLRADLYAIGVILFECLTGHRPFQAEALFDLLRQHVEAPPPLPRASRPELPPALEQVILVALAKTPDQRFPSAQAMSEALHQATAQLPPEQWAPVSPAAGAGAGAWSPTPPASWGSRSGAPSEPPRPGPPSTVSAGQVSAVSPPASKPGSSRLAWIMVGLVLLVGGGVTAAVLAGGGESSATTAAAGPTEAADGSASSAPAVGSGSAVATANADVDDTNDADDVDDEVDDAPAGASVPPTPSVVVATTKAATERARASTDAAQRLDKKLGKLDVIREIAKQDPDAAAEIAEALEDVDVDDDEPPAKPGAWLKRRTLSFPGFAAGRVDMAKVTAFALREAKAAVPDAELFRIDADGVSPDGFADLRLASHASDHGSIDFRFRSVSRSKRDPSLPLGVKQKWACEFRIEVEPSGVSMRPVDGWDCSKVKPVAPPRCSPKALWSKAVSKKAPTNAVANLGYRAVGSTAKWYFAIGYGFDVVYSTMFGDDC